MNKDELLDRLAECARESDKDRELAHEAADHALLLYINDKQITEAFFAIKRRYA